MSTILLVTSSPRGPLSNSSRVAKALVEQLQAGRRGTTVVHRDLLAEPILHIGTDFVAGIFSPPEAHTAEQAAAVARSNALIEEFLAADIVVIAAGLINFGVPSGLKAWIDHIVRAGKTFKYVEGRPQGLVTGKKLFLVESYGGVYSEGPYKTYNFADPYLKAILGFIGLTDVQTVVIEGTAKGPEATEKAVEAALASLPALVAGA